MNPTYSPVLLDCFCSVAMQLSRKTGGTPHSEMIWQFLHHCLDTFPECFVFVEPRVPQEGLQPLPGTSHGTAHAHGNKISEPVKGIMFSRTCRSVYIYVLHCVEQ